MTDSSIAISPIVDGIYAVDAACEADVEVRALLVCGTAFTLLADTLTRPADLESVRAFVESRGTPLLIVNSHADWDHWWGNAAFPQTPVIGHAYTLRRQRREGHRELATKRRRQAEFFAGVELCPATIAFEGFLTLDLGGVQVELSLLPGHTHDCIVAYVPEQRLLFAGDTAEDPIPLVTEGPIQGWPQRLREWAGRCSIVVPAHGAISGPELLQRNAAYLQGLLDDPGRHVPELDGVPAFYRRAHRRNLKRAAAEREKQS